MHYMPPIYQPYPYMMHRMGSYPSYGHGHYDVHYGEEQYEHDPFWKSASVRQFKKRKFILFYKKYKMQQNYIIHSF